MAAPKMDAASSRFKMDLEVLWALFVAPPINSSLSELFASYRSNMPWSAVEQLMNCLRDSWPPFVWLITAHSWVDICIRKNSMPCPDQELASLLAHQMAAHLEVIEVVVKGAGASIYQAKVLALHLVGIHSKAQAPGLFSLPYEGGPLCGAQAQLQHFLDATIQQTRQAQLLMDTWPQSVTRPAASGAPKTKKRKVCALAPAPVPAPAPKQPFPGDKGLGGKANRSWSKHRPHHH